MSAALAWGVPWVAALRRRAAAPPPRLPVAVVPRGGRPPARGGGGSVGGGGGSPPGPPPPAGPADPLQLVDEPLVRAPHPGEADGHATGERPLDAALGRPVEHKLDGDPRHRGPKSCDEAGLRRPPPPPAE